MKKFLIPVALFLSVETSFSQTSGYQFTTVVSNKTTPIKDQSSTSTCWCFAATSLMESGLLRMGKGEYDLSEMYIVRQKYMNQMEDNYLRRGKGNIGEGSLERNQILHYQELMGHLQPPIWWLSQHV